MKLYGGRYLQSEELLNLGIPVVGNDVQVHTTCVLAGLENLQIGNHVRIDAFCSLIAGTGRIVIGNHVHIGSYAFLSGSEGIFVSDFVSLSQGAHLYTRNDDYIGRSLTGPTIPSGYLQQDRGPVHIGQHVILGSGSVVLPGVSIAEGTTVGALSLVKRNLDPWGIYAGVPARRLRDRRRDLLESEAMLLEEEARQKS
jgi:acetyltransferase-like isoleucine patch superfamily enzyme